MRLRKVLQKAGIAAAAMGLGAGIAVQGVGCGDGEAERGAQGTPVSVKPALPAMDVDAPQNYETAAFAYG